MAIGKFGGMPSRPRYAQSPKSKAMHFSSRLCEPCNTKRTQPADREFERLHAAARNLMDAGLDPAKAMDTSRYAIGSDPYLNVFRYFAKLLCCHIADTGGPHFLALSRFALGEIDRNIVSLAINQDRTYQDISQHIEQPQYAAHGGLVVYGHRKTGRPSGFHSTLTVGPLQYVFFVRLNWFGRVNFWLCHREFYDWCRELAKDAEANPLSQEERQRLGFD